MKVYNCQFIGPVWAIHDTKIDLKSNLFCSIIFSRSLKKKISKILLFG